LLAVVQDEYPERDFTFHARVVRDAKSLIGELTDGLQKISGADSNLTLHDRLSFTWKLLRQADVCVWRLRKSQIANPTSIVHAAAAFQSILSVELKEPLLAAVLEWLRLGSDGRFLFHYWYFRKATTPSRLPEPFGNLAKTKDLDLLRTVVWWCLRARRETYVDVRQNEPVRIEFAFVVEQVFEDLKRWCGAEIDQLPDVTGEIERELNRWLVYSGLELPLDDAAPDANLDPDLAKAFIKHNELTTKLRIHRANSRGQADERVQQLEASIRQYADENCALEERLRVLETTSAPRDSVPTDLDSGLAAFAELREVLKTIDAKYAFDALSAVQLGEETHLTLRSFASHLFYALRKRGFTEYPKDETFTLTYDASGLYDCEGFEVPPGGARLVKVNRKGWALNARGRWLPVRRARVSPIETEVK